MSHANLLRSGSRIMRKLSTCANPNHRILCRQSVMTAVLLRQVVPTAQYLVTRQAHAPAKPAPEPEMFCYQCEQTKLRKGCTAVGVCGKTPEVAALQDLLVHVVKGLALYGHGANKLGAAIPAEAYKFTFSALFSTLTNVNFDAARFPSYISEALSYRDRLKALYTEARAGANDPLELCNLDEVTWSPSTDAMLDISGLHAKGKEVGVLQEKEAYGDDITGVRQMIIYGLKGMSTYARHGQLLGEWDDDIGKFTLEALAWLSNGPESERKDLAMNLNMALRVGEWNLRGLELLDKGHRSHFGIPSPTSVNMTPVPGKCILVSGHDLHDLYMILKATEGTGINVYTHGEMLPAHGYPKLREFKHLVGQFGTAWQLQKYEFPEFPGPIVVTTNCLTEPMKSYKDRLFTLNDCGWPDRQHLELPKDMDLLIQSAEQCKGFGEKRSKVVKKALNTGYGHDMILSQADQVIGAVKSGSLKRVFVIGGCDGSENKRSYYSTLADALPQETLILTMGCAKYRFNQYEFGTLPGTQIPRLMDMGQCNDAYGAVVVAKALAEAFSTDINSLPLSITLSWFEQKAVAVLLSLLHLGVKDIRVGPVLPAFLTQKVVDVLVEKFSITPVHIRHPIDDMEIMLGEKWLSNVEAKSQKYELKSKHVIPE